jgi:hypothetical protein
MNYAINAPLLSALMRQLSDHPLAGCGTREGHGRVCGGREDVPGGAGAGIAFRARRGYPLVMSSSHKFKIGQAVLYRGDFFRILGRLEIAGGQPTYRIRHETDDNERIARENELNDPNPHKRAWARRRA